LFLTQLRLLSETANGLAYDFLMSQDFCHAYLGKQFEAEIYTVHSPLF